MLIACERAERKSSCERETAELREWLSDLMRDGYRPLPLSADVVEISKAESASLARAPRCCDPLVVVAKDAVVIRNEPVAPPTDQERLTLLLPEKLREARASHETSRLLLSIEPTARWETVVLVIDAIREAGWREASVLFAGTPRQQPPESQRIETLLARMDDDANPSARLAHAAYGECQTAIDLATAAPPLGAYESPEYQAWERRLLSGLPNAVKACACAVDLSAVRAFHWYAAGRHREPHRVALSLQPVADAEASVTISEPASATWGTAYRELLHTAGERKVALSVERSNKP